MITTEISTKTQKKRKKKQNTCSDIFGQTGLINQMIETYI